MNLQPSSSNSKMPVLFLIGTFILLLSGCNQEQPVVYEIPKEKRSVGVPTEVENSDVSVNDPPKMQLLPGMQEAAEAAGEIHYQVPVGWKELPATGIRKATLEVISDAGSAEITVLTFPGDVGGTLANINRWRGQIGLEPATPESSAGFTEVYEIANHEGLYVRLEGETQSILGALLPFHGNTWFFKMLGDTPIVLANESAMKQFLDSVSFADHAH